MLTKGQRKDYAIFKQKQRQAERNTKIAVAKQRAGRDVYRKMKANDPLDRALTDLKHLTAAWYSRMSGAVEWKPGERESFAVRFAELDREIEKMQANDTAEWFAGLPT